MSFVIDQARKRLLGPMPPGLAADLKLAIEEAEAELRQCLTRAETSFQVIYDRCVHRWDYQGEERNDYSVWRCPHCGEECSARVWRE